MKLAILASLILGTFHCFSQGNVTLPITITIKIEKEYELKKSKRLYAGEIQNHNYEIKSDSVKQKYFEVSLEIKNTSDKPIGIWLMKCSWENNFLINNNYIFFNGRDCDKNYPTILKLAPGQSISDKTTLKKSIKFDYPCRHCVYGEQVEETKLGLIVIDDVYKNNLREHSYHLAMEDKSRWKIVWSNGSSLLSKHP